MAGSTILKMAENSAPGQGLKMNARKVLSDVNSRNVHGTASGIDLT